MVSLLEVKELGKNRCSENLSKLLKLYDIVSDIDIKREIVSSIGRQKDYDTVYNFIKDNVYNCKCMDLQKIIGIRYIIPNMRPNLKLFVSLKCINYL